MKDEFEDKRMYPSEPEHHQELAKKATKGRVNLLSLFAASLFLAPPPKKCCCGKCKCGGH